MQTMEGERGKSYSHTVLGRIGTKEDAPETEDEEEGIWGRHETIHR